MKKVLLASTLLAAIGASPAGAVLQISMSDGAGPIFTCQDGQLGCDLAGPSNNILTINTLVDGHFLVFGTLSFSSFGTTNQLSLSSFGILNQGAAGTITLLLSDTNFLAPVSSIDESASLTFNNAAGSSVSTLKFWADANNVQGANPSNTPGTLLDTVTGTPLTNPDSFSGSKNSPFSAFGPFSMTEGASINLIAGGSITGFNQDMQTSFSAIPEPSTWALSLLGFGLVGTVAIKRRKTDLRRSIEAFARG